MSEKKLIEKYFKNKPLKDIGWTLLEEYVEVKGELPNSLKELRVFVGSYSNPAFNLIQEFIKINQNIC